MKNQGMQTKIHSFILSEINIKLTLF